MSEPVSRPRLAAAFGAFAELLQALPTATAALDGALRVQWANPAFVKLAGLPGLSLDALFRLEEPVSPAGGAQRVRARTAAQVAVELHLVPAPFGFALTAQPLVRDEQDEQVQQRLLGLSRELILASTEEELVGALARAVRELFPGSSYCVRVVDPRTYALTSLYAEGKLRDAARQGIALKRSAVEKLGIERADLPPGRVEVLEEVPLVFTGTARGFATPLVSSGQLFGVLNVEFPPGDPRDGAVEERIVLRAANHAAAGLRNAKLFDEVSYVRRYLESLIEHANALIVVVNPERRVIVANAATLKLLGRARESLLGTDLLPVLAEADRARVAHLLEESLRGGPASSFEAALLTAAGRAVRVGFSVASVRSSSGEVEGVIAVGQDLTQLRALEEQVIQAEKLASLGQLAAGVAHEINNPLTTISIYADALLQRHAPGGGPLGLPADARDVDKLQRIVEAADRILKLARDLTSYARPAGDQTERVNLEAVVDQAVSFCDHVVKESEVQVSRAYGSGLPQVVAVRSQLIQVFVNLLTNACHATAPGGAVEVSVTGRGGAVEVRVRDTGKGIAPEHLGRIFEPFFTTKAAGEGTGLGLSIVQGIVAKHGGQIRVTSELGKGTEFVVQLPASEAGR